MENAVRLESVVGYGMVHSTLGGMAILHRNELDPLQGRPILPIVSLYVPLRRDMTLNPGASYDVHVGESSKSGISIPLKSAYGHELPWLVQRNDTYGEVLALLAERFPNEEFLALVAEKSTLPFTVYGVNWCDPLFATGTKKMEGEIFIPFRSNDNLLSRISALRQEKLHLSFVEING